MNIQARTGEGVKVASRRPNAAEKVLSRDRPGAAWNIGVNHGSRRLLRLFFRCLERERRIEIDNLSMEAQPVERETQLEPTIVAELHSLGVLVGTSWRELAHGQKGKADVLLAEYFHKFCILRGLDPGGEFALFRAHIVKSNDVSIDSNRQRSWTMLSNLTPSFPDRLQGFQSVRVRAAIASFGRRPEAVQRFAILECGTAEVSVHQREAALATHNMRQQGAGDRFGSRGAIVRQ